jgi:hypothetical protein
MHSGLVDIAPASRARADAFLSARSQWRGGTARFYARHIEVEAFAAQVLGVMFDAAERLESPAREYLYTARALGAAVRVNVDNWHWFVRDGSADGRGLYELWAWRFSVSIEQAHAEIWACRR